MDRDQYNQVIVNIRRALSNSPGFKQLEAVKRGMCVCVKFVGPDERLGMVQQHFTAEFLAEPGLGDKVYQAALKGLTTMRRSAYVG